MGADKSMTTDQVRAEINRIEHNNYQTGGTSKAVMKKSQGGGKAAAKGSTSAMKKC